MRDIQISNEPIELYQLLKLADLAASGGEAKFLITRGDVRLNGAVETRKRKKVFSGDRVTLGENSLVVSLAGDRG